MRNERPSLADSIRGDLSEERARLARTQSPVRAAAWHARTAFGIAAHVMLLRIADGLREFGRGLRFDRLRGDGRQALRTLRRSPWYAATATVVVGNTGGIMERTDEDGWVAQEPATNLSLHACWIDSGGGVWAVGGKFDDLPLREGVLVHRGDAVSSDIQ